jgi:hypothetical protein
MKTAMQDLREDLIISIGTCNKALEEIKDLRTREACQAVVNLTIDNILNRIDTELLEKEKQQIIDAFDKAYPYDIVGYNAAEQYYTEIFKSE